MGTASRLHKLPLLIMAVFAAPAPAATVAYFQFQDGAAGTTAGTTATEVNHPNLDGTAQSSSGGPKPTFSASVPGSPITDGVGGPTVNASNSTSLLFVNPDTPGSVTSSVGGRISVPDTGAALELRSFTIEAFVRVNNDVDFPDIVNKSRADANGSSWMMDVNSNGTLRVRVDSQPISVTSGSGFNQSFSSTKNLQDGNWHHVAATYNDTTKSVTLFVDYAQVGSGTTTNNIVYDSQPMLIGQGGGGRAFDGWIDEVRYSDTILTPSQFLQAVPEPSSLAIVGCLSLGLLQRRRRARA